MDPSESALERTYRAAGLDYAELRLVFSERELEELVEAGSMGELPGRATSRLLSRLRAAQNAGSGEESRTGAARAEEGAQAAATGPMDELQGAPSLDEEPAPVLGEAAYARLRKLYTEEQLKKLVGGDAAGATSAGEAGALSGLARLERIFRRRPKDG